MTRDRLKLPSSTTFSLGAKVGRFSSAVIVALIPDHPVIVVEEMPNYHYVGDGEIELAGFKSIVEWGEYVVRTWASYAGPSPPCRAWVEPETEFEKELARCKMRLRRNYKHSAELRTEVLREYFQDSKILFTPWLDVLPNEVQRARWPPEESSAYQVRAVGQDYTLHALEQVISRRPMAVPVTKPKRSHWLQQYLNQHRIHRTRGDVHLGTQ